MRKIWWLLLPLVLIIAFFAGPQPDRPPYETSLPVVPHTADSLDTYISTMEAAHRLKPDNEARVVWYNDSLKNKTDYAIVYLHGFSASQAEGDPVHRDIARQFGCNLYLSRLAEHGIDTTEPMQNLTAENYWNSAKEALSIGRQLGKKVILMGTSTGGTLALQLAAAYPDVAGLVLLSPNIAINDDNAWLLNGPWGLQLARMVKGSDYITSDDNRPQYTQYWYKRYRLEAAVALEELLESGMTPETFHRVKQPVLLLYYYKDKVHQDSVVKVDAMLKMFDELGTPTADKKAIPLPNAGNHVLGNPLRSHAVPDVEKQTSLFLQQVMGLAPVAADSTLALYE